MKGVDLHLHEGEILGLLGPNGAGKSSTFNMITLQTRRTAGDITLFGKKLGEKGFEMGNLSITAQDNILWPSLSI